MEALKIVYDQMALFYIGLLGWILYALLIYTAFTIIQKVVKFIIKIIYKFGKPKATEGTENDGI